MSNLALKVKGETIAACLTCPLCNKLFRDAITISECLHTFCRKCLYDRISDEELDGCPVCNIDLGCVPLGKLRPNHNLQDLRAKIFQLKRKTVSAREAAFSATFPARRKERSLSSLVVSTPKVSSQGAPTGKRTKTITRKVAALQGSSSEEEHTEGSSSPETLKKFTQNKRQDAYRKAKMKKPVFMQEEGQTSKDLSEEDDTVLIQRSLKRPISKQVVIDPQELPCSANESEPITPVRPLEETAIVPYHVPGFGPTLSSVASGSVNSFDPITGSINSYDRATKIILATTEEVLGTLATDAMIPSVENENSVPNADEAFPIFAPINEDNNQDGILPSTLPLPLASPSGVENPLRWHRLFIESLLTMKIQLVFEGRFLTCPCFTEVLDFLQAASLDTFDAMVVAMSKNDFIFDAVAKVSKLPGSLG